MTSQHNDDNSLGSESESPDFYTISAKLYALGELIKFRGGEPSLAEERVNYGLGVILTELAEAMAGKNSKKD